MQRQCLLLILPCLRMSELLKAPESLSFARSVNPISLNIEPDFLFVHSDSGQTNSIAFFEHSFVRIGIYGYFVTQSII